VRGATPRFLSASTPLQARRPGVLAGIASAEVEVAAIAAELTTGATAQVLAAAGVEVPPLSEDEDIKGVPTEAVALLEAWGGAGAGAAVSLEAGGDSAQSSFASASLLDIARKYALPSRLHHHSVAASLLHLPPAASPPDAALSSPTAHGGSGAGAGSLPASPKMRHPHDIPATAAAAPVAPASPSSHQQQHSKGGQHFHKAEGAQASWAMSAFVRQAVHHVHDHAAAVTAARWSASGGGNVVLLPAHLRAGAALAADPFRAVFDPLLSSPAALAAARAQQGSVAEATLLAHGGGSDLGAGPSEPRWRFTRGGFATVSAAVALRWSSLCDADFAATLASLPYADRPRPPMGVQAPLPGSAAPPSEADVADARVAWAWLALRRTWLRSQVRMKGAHCTAGFVPPAYLTCPRSFVHLSQASALLAAYNADIEALRVERARLQCHSVAGSLRLLVLRQEYALLQVRESGLPSRERMHPF
jgi:hypothetical protein